MLDPISATAIGFAVAFLLKKRNATATVIPPSNPPAAQESDTPKPSRNDTRDARSTNPLKDVLGGMGMNPGLTAAAMAYLAAGGYVGGKLNGPTGAVIGTINPYLGNSYNAGAAAGTAINKEFGADEKSTATGAVASVGGGLTALSGAVFGTFAALAIGPVVAVTWLISVALEDSARLRYGQAGALRDLQKKWDDTYNTLMHNVTENVKSSGYSIEPMDLVNMIREYTNGYIKQCNELSYQAAMSKPRGASMTDAAHGRYWRDRGAFVGDIDNAGRLLDTFAYRQADGSTKAAYTAGSGQTYTGYSTGGNELQGMINANKEAYVSHIQSPPGWGVNSYNHCKYGWENGKYKQGNCHNDGSYTDPWGNHWDTKGNKV